MPSSPSFDDGLFLLRLAWKIMVEKAKPESDCTQYQREVAGKAASFYATLGVVFDAVRANGDLPSDKRRRALRLMEIYNDTMVKAATSTLESIQKPAEN